MDKGQARRGDEGIRPGDQRTGPDEQRELSFLALGDSYTIGEGVECRDSFPFQTVNMLRAAGHRFPDPAVLARTGWTTGELIKALEGATSGKAAPDAGPFHPPFGFVSLLIGVNNEYRGQSLRQFDREFRSLLESAIRLAGNRPGRTFVVSIPDWSVTPFAAIHLPDALGRDRQTISREIDEFNQVAARHAAACAVDFIDITSHSRKAGYRSGDSGDDSQYSDSRSESSWFASDGLHPSGRQYRHWAEQLAARIGAQLAGGK
ncbi:MAG: GDSL-type esterase/lipase family protein [Bacteroidota bacterium]|nr:GDSL-type esterase/lipase family protein [Bacteroidota bacterium]